MESNYQAYNFEKSFDRMKEILNASDLNFTEVDGIPSRDQLTFTNGFYVNCTAMFADIRRSSELPSKYQRPTLARIYRSYVVFVNRKLDHLDHRIVDHPGHFLA